MSRLNSLWNIWCQLFGLVGAAIVTVELVGWRAVERYITGAVKIPEQVVATLVGSL